MDTLPKYTHGYLFLFCDADSAQNLRISCKQMKNALDVDISVLDSAKSRPKIIKNDSLGLTYVTIREMDGKGCVCCGVSKRKRPCQVHPFFDVTVCKRCRVNEDVFRIGGFKSMCKKHFIHEGEARASKRLRTVLTRGKRVERVLESDMVKISEEVVGEFEKMRLSALRDTRSLIIYQNRLSAVSRREDDLRKRFDLHVKEYTYSEISKTYRDFELILTICPKICRSILHDIFDHRIRVRKQICCVLVGMVSICKMLTLLDYYNLLVPYPGGKRFQLIEELTEYLSIKQLYIRGNYEVLIPQYFRSIRSFRTKSEELNFRYNRDPSICTEYDRFEVAEYACELDEVEFNENIFEDFIYNNVGDPFVISRSIKKMNFLLDNGYEEMFLATNSTWVARVHVLNNTMGYCPM